MPGLSQEVHHIRCTDLVDVQRQLQILISKKNIIDTFQVFNTMDDMYPLALIVVFHTLENTPTPPATETALQVLTANIVNLRTEALAIKGHVYTIAENTETPLNP